MLVFELFLLASFPYEIVMVNTLEICYQIGFEVKRMELVAVLSLW